MVRVNGTGAVVRVSSAGIVVRVCSTGEVVSIEHTSAGCMIYNRVRSTGVEVRV